MQENAEESKDEICSQSRPDAPQHALKADTPCCWAWNHGPTEKWMGEPIASRQKIGRDVVSRALLTIRKLDRNGARDNPRQQYRMDTWSSPFTVWYLNVGRRHLVGSLEEVVELILKHRPDILFLGDLVTTCAHIGRLKKRLEGALKDEWSRSNTAIPRDVPRVYDTRMHARAHARTHTHAHTQRRRDSE